MSVFGEQQRDIAPRPHAADAHHLERGILQPVAVQQHAAIVGKRVAVVHQSLFDTRRKVGLGDMKQDRRLVDDAVAPANQRSDLGKEIFEDAFARALGDLPRNLRSPALGAASISAFASMRLYQTSSGLSFEHSRRCSR